MMHLYGKQEGFETRGVHHNKREGFMIEICVLAEKEKNFYRIMLIHGG